MRCPTTRPLPLLIAAAILTASCATTPAQPPPAALADELLASAIIARLNADPVYYFRHVNVAVDHGVAQLTGYVWSTDALYGARRIARSVPGVSRVLTAQLELERNGHAGGVAR